MSATKSFDVIGLGNAIVDVLTHADDAFVARHGMTKGTMALIDQAQAEGLYADMGPGVEVSGGSAANTIAGIAALGGHTAFIGKVADDQLGTVFAHDIRSLGVAFATPASNGGLGTARCYVLVTPDAQRTMNTFLGACTQLKPEDVDPAQVSAGKVLYIEGYLWDEPDAKAACMKAIEAMHASGGKVAMTLSDVFCVDRYRAEFLDLARNHIDILFANEAEIAALFEIDDFDEAARRVSELVEIAALTRSEKGSVVVNGADPVAVPAAPVEHVADTTGAGDLYAAGFLYGLTNGFDLARAARLGGLAAAEVISHIGARPEIDLKSLIEQSAA